MLVLGDYERYFWGKRFGAQVFMIDHNHTNASKASSKKAQNGHSTDIIVATSDVKIAIKSEIAESLMNFSSYQMLTVDKHSQRHHARTKLVKMLAVMTANSCYNWKNNY